VYNKGEKPIKIQGKKWQVASGNKNKNKNKGRRGF
jgi:hypothetical protein